MALTLARVLAAALELYGVAGLGFALLFLPRAACRLDPRLGQSPVTVRFLILPGVAALWPLFARRWAMGIQIPEERNPHRDAASRRTDPGATR